MIDTARLAAFLLSTINVGGEGALSVPPIPYACVVRVFVSFILATDPAIKVRREQDLAVYLGQFTINCSAFFCTTRTTRGHTGGGDHVPCTCYFRFEALSQSIEINKHDVTSTRKKKQEIKTHPRKRFGFRPSPELQNDVAGVRGPRPIGHVQRR